MTITTDVDFAAAVEPLRRELLAHCYRMTGSVHDAQDVLQDTYLRAWKGMRDFEHRSSLRTWMYRIATNACLTHLEGRARRPLPSGLGGPADPRLEPREDHATPWLEPLPDSLVWAQPPADPADEAVRRDDVRLAFVAALQHLTAQQRAVLLLREVLRWSAAEVAEELGLTVAGVNSTLQRARAQVAKLDEGDVDEPQDEGTRALLEAYVAAFEAYDIPGIVRVMAADVVWEMPPYPGWYRGAQNVGTLIGTWCPASGPGSIRLVRTSANGLPVFALYMREADGLHHAFQVQQVSVGRGRVQHVTVWFGKRLFTTFGLPEMLPVA